MANCCREAGNGLERYLCHVHAIPGACLIRATYQAHILACAYRQRESESESDYGIRLWFAIKQIKQTQCQHIMSGISRVLLPYPPFLSRRLAEMDRGFLTSVCIKWKVDKLFVSPMVSLSGSSIIFLILRTAFICI